MELVSFLPHISGLLNSVIAALLLLGYAAIKRGNRAQHERLMKSAVGVGCVFIACYAVQTVTQGHHRFPGEDWLRKAFVVILLTHTALAIVVVPMIIRTLYLARHERFDSHRRWARWTFPTWVYVAVTGVVIYVLNNWVRPH